MDTREEQTWGDGDWSNERLHIKKIGVPTKFLEEIKVLLQAALSLRDKWLRRLMYASEMLPREISHRLCQLPLDQLPPPT